MHKVIKYIPLGLLCLCAIKGLVLSFGYVDAPILLILAGLAGFYEFKIQNEAIEIVHKRCEIIDSHISKLYVEQEALKTNLSTVKLSQTMRNVGTK